MPIVESKPESKPIVAEKKQEVKPKHEETDIPKKKTGRVWNSTLNAEVG